MAGNAEKSQRILWIDVARGLAIIAVVFGHTIVNRNNANFFVNFIYLFHMPIFFFLSGLLYHPKAPKKGLSDLFKSVFKPYFVTSILLILIWFLQHTIKSKFLFTFFPNLKSVLISVLYGVGLPPVNPFHWVIIQVGAIWFLLAFLLARLIFDIIMLLIKVEKIRAIVITVLAIFGSWIGTYWLLPWSLNGALASLPYLFIGYLMRKYNLLTRIPGWLYFIFAVYWVLGAKLMTTYLLVAPSLDGLWIKFPVSIMAIICVCKVSQTISERFVHLSKILKWYGAGSLIILCFHLIQLEFDNVFQLFVYQFHLDFGRLSIGLLWSVYRLIFPTVMLLLVRKVPFLSKLFFMTKKDDTKKSTSKKALRH